LIHLKNNARIKECVFFWTSNERVNTGRKIWRHVKGSGKGAR
jgi:hypothetical protein